VVLGGNGRTMGMQRAYHQYPEQAAELKDYLTKHAQAFGLTPAHVDSFKQPILVRRMKDAGDDTTKLRALGRRMNEALTQGLDPRSAEVALGKNYVNPEVMASLTHNMEADESLAEFLHSTKSSPFVSALERAGIIDQYNRAEFVDKENGLLNEDGRLRVERVLAARLIPDASLLSRMNQSLRQNIAKAVPYFAAMEDSGWDMRESLKLAVQADIDARNRGMIKRGKEGVGRGEYLRQKGLDLGGGQLQDKVNADPVALALMEVLQEHNGSKKLPAGFKQVALEADRQKHDHGDQGAMFGRTTVTPAEAVGAAFKLKGTRGAVAQEQQGLALSLDALVKAVASGGGAGRYLMHAITWEAKRLVLAAMTETELSGPKLLKRLRAFVKEQTLTDRTFAVALGAHPVSDQTLRGLLQAAAAVHESHLAKSLARAALEDGYWFAKATGAEYAG
jgi:hypothetical protein